MDRGLNVIHTISMLIQLNFFVFKKILHGRKFTDLARTGKEKGRKKERVVEWCGSLFSNIYTKIQQSLREGIDCSVQ